MRRLRTGCSTSDGEQYAERWSGNAAAYEAQGLYLRLAEHLASFGKFSRITDIGCGRGEGLVALRQITGETACLCRPTY